MITIKLPEKSMVKGWDITPFSIRNNIQLDEKNSKTYEITFLKDNNIYHFKKIKETNV
jgi:hypothetical protein